MRTPPRHSVWTWLLVLLFAGLLPCPSRPVQAEQPKPAAKKTPEFDLEKFGRLPVRFNGRVTTYDVVARNVLLRISGRPFYHDEDGNKQPAIRWLLESVSGHDRAQKHKVFPIENSKLLELLQLEPRRAPRHHKSRYSYREYGEAKGLDDFRRLLRGDPTKPPGEKSPLERAVRDLDSRLYLYMTFVYSHMAVAGDDKPRLRHAVELLPHVESSSLPQVLPPARPGQTWKTLLRGSLESAAGRLAGGEKATSPPLDYLAKLLGAIADDDPEAFNRTTDAYHAYLKTHKAWHAPLSFDAPKGWIETGVPIVKRLAHYGDTMAMGTRVVAFYKETKQNELDHVINVNYFPGKTAPVHAIFNFWRFSQGLVPLRPEQMKPLVRMVRVSGTEATYVEVVSPEEEAVQRDYSISAIVKRGGQTWVLSISGPGEITEKKRKTFKQFLRSFQIGPQDELVRWFDVKKENELPHTRQWRVQGAVLREGRRAWLVQLLTTAAEADHQRADFERFVRSIRQRPSDDPKRKEDLGVTWTAPEGWKRSPSREGSPGQMVFSAKGKRPTVYVGITVDLLGEATEDSLVPLANYARRGLELPPMTAEQAAKAFRTIEAEGPKVTLFDFTGPPPEVLFTKPKEWIETSPNTVFGEYARFRVGEADDKADITVSRLSAKATVADNVNRWRRQAGLEPWSEEQIRHAVRVEKVGGMDGTYVDLTGPDSADPSTRRIVGVIVSRDDATWFFKIRGPVKTVEAQKKAFDAFVQSIKFSPRPDHGGNQPGGSS